MAESKSARSGIGALSLAGLLVISACGSPTETPTGSSPGPSTSAAHADQPHNQQDVSFAEQMIPHHQQAVEMSEVILSKPDIDPRVVQLANQIKAAQGPEIEQMRGWLKQWGAPAMPGMEHHGGAMAGMMSAEDMDALKNAQGADAATLFLNQMIKHHEGAIAMAHTEIDAGQFQPAVAMAKSIATGQQQEIADMQDILRTP